jgi:serine/threonine protein kinase
MGGVTELEPGEVFAGRYEVQRPLGEGDRKRTYLALDRKMDRLVAISLVKPESVLSDPQGTERGSCSASVSVLSLFAVIGGGTLEPPWIPRAPRCSVTGIC